MKTGNRKISFASLRKAVIATRALFSASGLRALPGVPTAWLGGAYAGSKGRPREQSLAFFRDREDCIVEKASGKERLLMLRPAGDDSILTTDLPPRVVSPASLVQSLGWPAPRPGPGMTLHALTSAMVPLYNDLGISNCRATWITARVQRRTTRLAVHAAETGELLFLATMPTTPLIFLAGISGWGFAMKVLLLLGTLVLLAAVAYFIFGTGPVTGPIFAAAAAALKFALILALLEIIILILDILVEIYMALFPNQAAKIAALRAKLQAAQNLKQALKDKKDAKEDVGPDDINQLKDMAKDTEKEVDDLAKEISDDLPGATGDRKKELEEGRSAIRRMRDALRELQRFIAGLGK